MMLRRGAGGHYVNGAVARWPRAAISLRDESTRDRADAGDLLLRNLFLADNGATFQPQSPGSSTFQFTVDAGANQIEIVDDVSAADLFVGLPANPDADALDWTPAPGSPLATGGLATFPAGLAERAGDFITPTAFRGAADPNGPKWWAGWTNYARN
jgi:hypothetical protein